MKKLDYDNPRWNEIQNHAEKIWGNYFTPISLPIMEKITDGNLWEYIDVQTHYEDSPYPSWGTCWEWKEVGTDEDTFMKLAMECGFIVIRPTEFTDVVLAIDGGGYDFYEKHWVPLFEKMGCFEYLLKEITTG